jgi:hypothetical protein
MYQIGNIIPNVIVEKSLTLQATGVGKRAPLLEVAFLRSDRFPLVIISTPSF